MASSRKKLNVTSNRDLIPTEGFRCHKPCLVSKFSQRSMDYIHQPAGKDRTSLFIHDCLFGSVSFQKVSLKTL